MMAHGERHTFRNTVNGSHREERRIDALLLHPFFAPPQLLLHEHDGLSDSTSPGLSEGWREGQAAETLCRRKPNGNTIFDMIGLTKILTTDDACQQAERMRAQLNQVQVQYC